MSDSIDAIAESIIAESKQESLSIPSVNNLFNKRFKIGKKEIYLKGFEDITQNYVVLSINGEEQVIEREEAVNLLRSELKKEINTILEDVRENVGPKHADEMEHYIYNLIDNVGYMTIGEKATDKYLQEQGTYYKNISAEEEPNQHRVLSFEYNEKTKSVDFTEEFPVENFSKYSLEEDDSYNLNATVKIKSSIGIQEGKILTDDWRAMQDVDYLRECGLIECEAVQKITKISISRKNANGLDLFPSEQWQNKFKSRMQSILHSVSESFAKLKIKEKAVSSFSTIRNKISSKIKKMSIPNELKKLDKELDAIDEQYGNSFKSVDGILSIFEQMSNENVFTRGSISSNGRAIRDRVEAININPNTLEKLESRINSLESSLEPLQLNAGKNEQKITAIEDKISALRNKIEFIKFLRVKPYQVLDSKDNWELLVEQMIGLDKISKEIKNESSNSDELDLLQLAAKAQNDRNLDGGLKEKYLEIKEKFDEIQDIEFEASMEQTHNPGGQLDDTINKIEESLNTVRQIIIELDPTFSVNQSL